MASVLMRGQGQSDSAPLRDISTTGSLSAGVHRQQIARSCIFHNAWVRARGRDVGPALLRRSSRGATLNARVVQVDRFFLYSGRLTDRDPPTALITYCVGSTDMLVAPTEGGVKCHPLCELFASYVVNPPNIPKSPYSVGATEMLVEPDERTMRHQPTYRCMHAHAASVRAPRSYRATSTYRCTMPVLPERCCGHVCGQCDAVMPGAIFIPPSRSPLHMVPPA